ncbi:MAG TPA: DNA replication and repair protein RecF [Chitinivibrionales bacterium]|nr:DNA replication and repair protein RecF [Chitinivibrionales bacterium]
MYLSRLHLDNFRNYKDLSLDIPERGALFSGPNGSGKTNLLEAVFLLCTARSQRGAARGDLIRFSSDYSYVEGVFSKKENGAETQVSIGFNREQKVSMKVNDRAISSFSQWLGHGMAVSFGPDDLKLVQGAPRERRNFLDIFISQIDPAYLDSLIMYKKNLTQRNNLLSKRFADAQLDAYEDAMVLHGAPVFAKRHELCAAMAPVFANYYGEISGGSESAAMEYRPSVKCDSGAEKDWKKEFYSSLKNAKNRDIQNCYSSVGPHRDDVALFVNGNDARSFASIGQCSTISLSLRMSSVLVSGRYRKEAMIFLFDDAVSYLDAMRTSRVFPLLERRGQLLITAPSNREPRLADMPHFTVQEGAVTAR